MSLKSKNLLSGRASVVALVLAVFALVAGYLMVPHRAMAQVSGASVGTQFAPDTLVDQSLSNGAGNVGLNIHCLLPAVQHAVVPFTIIAKTPDGTATYNVPIGGETFGWYE